MNANDNTTPAASAPGAAPTDGARPRSGPADGLPAVAASGMSRRGMLGGLAGLAAGAVGLAACTGDPDEQPAGAAAAAGAGGDGGGGGGGQATGGESLLDKIAREGKVSLAVDLGFAPLQFRDPATEEPTGYSIEVTKLLMAELEAEIEWVEIPFAQLVPAIETGRADMGGIAATNLPSRARSVTFSRVPTFIESNLALLSSNAAGSISSIADMNNPDVRIAVLVGSSQADQAPKLIPDATYVELEQAQAQQEVSTGRADVLISSEFALLSGTGEMDLDNVEVLDAPPLFADINTFFMPMADTKLHAFVDNFLLYSAQRGTLAALWEEWIGADVREVLGGDSISVQSPWVAASEVL